MWIVAVINFFIKGVIRIILLTNVVECSIRQDLISFVDINKILAIVGPTGIGKTQVAIAIAKKIEGEIIGLDSRQIYKNMTIGTAQPTQKELREIPHHLIAIKNPNESLSAGEYRRMALEQITDILDKDRKPILCGGAGLYLEALINGLFEGSTANIDIRKKLNAEYDQNPINMLKKLTSIDPVYAEKIHVNNKKRLVRAMEIIELTGKPPSEHFLAQQSGHSSGFQYCIILLSMDMSQLEARIRKRTQTMLTNGWIEEAAALMKQYKPKDAHPLDSIGYRQIYQYLEGKYTLDELENEIVLRTRQYAKRQLTWFRNRSHPIEIDTTIFNNINAISDEIIGRWRSF